MVIARSPARDRTKITAFTTRVTAQLGQKNKVTVLYNPQTKFRQYLFGEVGTYTITGAPVQDLFTNALQAKWTGTLSSRVLVEAGPRATLTTLARQQLTAGSSRVAVAMLGDSAEGDAEWKSVMSALGQLWQAGVAREERDIAQRETAKTLAVQEYLVGLFEAADPANTQGELITAQEIVRRGIEQLEESLDTEPEIHIEMLKVLGRVEQALGNFNGSTGLLDQALGMSREIYGQEHLNSAAIAAMLGDAARWNGELDRAETMLREALEIRRRLVRGDDAEVAINMDRLARVLEMLGNLMNPKPFTAMPLQ